MQMTKEELKEVEINKSALYKSKGNEPFHLAMVNGKDEFEVGKYYPDKEEFEVVFTHPQRWGVVKCFDLRKEALDRKHGLIPPKEIKEEE